MKKSDMKRGQPPRRKKPFIRGQSRTSLVEIRRDLVERCCGKKTWATREAAEVALNRIMLISTEETHPRRVYECRKGNWHLTSRPDRYAAYPAEPVPGAAKPVTPARKATPATVRRWRYTGPADDVRAMLRARSGDLCEIGVLCGGGAQGVDPSHRIAKGMGGSSLASINAVTAILWACRADHDYVESHPEESYAAGWKVKHGDVDPADVPVMIASVGGGSTVYLTASGEYSSAPEVPGA